MTNHSHRTSIRDTEILDALLVGLEPVAPSRERALLLRERVLSVARVDGAVDDKVTIHADAGKWRSILPKVSMKMLHATAQSRSFLLRLEPGGSLPPHDHPGDEECMVLEGEVFLGAVHATAGAFHLAPRGTRHGEIRSPAGALLYLRVDSAEAVHG